jgi:hypothetical protein
MRGQRHGGKAAGAPPPPWRAPDWSTDGVSSARRARGNGSPGSPNAIFCITGRYEYGASAFLGGLWGPTHPGAVASGHAICNIPWALLCSLWSCVLVGGDFARRSSRHRPTQIGVLGCACSWRQRTNYKVELGGSLRNTEYDPIANRTGLFNTRDSGR